MAIGILAGVGALVLIVVGAYNSLVGRRNRAYQALSTIDVQLTQRYDLIPKLVETVKQYMVHERSLLEDIVRLRGEAMRGTSPVERVNANNELTRALGQLNVSVENYPQLRANEGFLQLQRSLNEVEEQLAAARRTYNAAATDYNNGVQMVPMSLVASAGSFEPMPLFIADEAKRGDVDMKQLFGK
jgi:LemA protein